MKNFKSICASLLLALCLSITAFAGDGHTTGEPNPPDPDDTDNVSMPGEAAATPDISGMILADVLLAWLA